MLIAIIKSSLYYIISLLECKCYLSLLHLFLYKTYIFFILFLFLGCKLHFMLIAITIIFISISLLGCKLSFMLMLLIAYIYL